MAKRDPPLLEFNAQTVMAWSVTLAVSIAFLVVGKKLLIPLAIAILFWSLLNAVAAFFRRMQWGGHQLPSSLAMTLAIAALLALNWSAYQIIINEADALTAAAPGYQENFSRLMEQVSAWFGIEAMPATNELLAKLDIGALLTWLGESVGSVLGDFVLILVYMAFLLSEQHRLPGKLSHLVPRKTEATLLSEAAMGVSRQVQRYVWMKTLVSALTGLVSYFVLLLVGVDFAGVWALLAFLLNFIPNIGSVIAVALPSMLALVQFDTMRPFVLVVLALGAGQFFVGNVIEPRLMGRSLNLSPFMILFSLAFWGSIWGIPGMFLSVPLMVVTAIVCSHFRELRWVAVMLSADGRLMTTPRES